MPEIENPRIYKVETDVNGNILRIRSSLGECIPVDPGNSHYQQFLESADSKKTFELSYEYTFEGKLEAVRTQRNRKLEESDKYVLPDFPIEDIEKGEWLAYRLLLRELPSTLTEENIDTFEWPPRPDEVTEAE